VGAVLAGVFLAINPVLAILINNGSAILAELNGLRPLMGPTGLPDWLQPRSKVSLLRSLAVTAEAGGVAPAVEENRAPAISPILVNTEAKPGSWARQARPLGAIAPHAPAPRSIPLPESLIQKDLAARLGVSPQTLSRRKRQSTFAQWSRTRDPGRVAWRYAQQEQIFHPVLADTLLFRAGQERDPVSRSGHHSSGDLAASG